MSRSGTPSTPQITGSGYGHRFHAPGWQHRVDEPVHDRAHPCAVARDLGRRQGHHREPAQALVVGPFHAQESLAAPGHEARIDVGIAFDLRHVPLGEARIAQHRHAVIVAQQHQRIAGLQAALVAGMRQAQPEGLGAAGQIAGAAGSG